MGSVENSARIEESLHSDMKLGTSQVPCNSSCTENVGSFVDGNVVDRAVSQGDCDIPSVGSAGHVNTCKDKDSFCAERDSSWGEETNNECDDEMNGIHNEIAPANLSDGDVMALKGVSENGFLVVSAQDGECLPAESFKMEVSGSFGDEEATNLTKLSVLEELSGGGMPADDVHDTKQNNSSYHLAERSVDAVSTADNALSRVDMATCCRESVSPSKAFTGSITEMEALNSNFHGEMDGDRTVGLKDGILLHAVDAKVNPDASPVEVISQNSQKSYATKSIYTDVQGINQVSEACVKVPIVQMELQFVEEKIDGHVGNLVDGSSHMLGSAVCKVTSKENLTEEDQWNGCSLKMVKDSVSEEVDNSPQKVDTYDGVSSLDASGVPLENEVNISCSSHSSKDLCVDASVTDMCSLPLPSKDHDGKLEHSCPVDADIESAKDIKETSSECVDKTVNSDSNDIDEPAPVKCAGYEISVLEAVKQIPSDVSSSSDLFYTAQNEQKNHGSLCSGIVQKCTEATHVDGDDVISNSETTAPECPSEALDVQAHQPSPTFENCCSNMQDLSSLETDFISTLENEERNYEEKGSAVPNCHSEVKVPIIVFSSSRRSSQANKSGRKTQAKRAAKNSRNASKVASCSANEELVLKAAKRKRSSCFKKAKSSEWGRLQNISNLFVQMNELDLKQISGRGSQRARSGRRCQKQKRKPTTGSRQVSKGKQHVSSTCIRLKVKLGETDLDIMGPQVACTAPLPNAVASENSSQERSCSVIQIDAADSENNLREDGLLKVVECLDKNPEENFDQNNAQETTTFLKKTCGNAEKGYLDAASFAEMGTGVTDGRYLDPETSPDSEVINTTPEAPAVETHGDGIHGVVLHSAEDLNTCKDITSTKREKKKNRVCHGSNQSNESSNSSVGERPKPVKKNSCGMKPSENFHLGESFASLPNASNSSSNKKELVPISSETEVGFSNVSLTDAGNDDSNYRDESPHMSELENFKSVLSSAKRKGQKLPKVSKSTKSSNPKSKVSNSTKGKGGNARRPKEKLQRSVNRRKVKGNGISHQFPCKVEIHVEADGDQVDDGCKKINRSADSAVVDILKSEDMIGNTVEWQSPTHNAWVRCDDCHKWRRIPAALADSIEDTNSNWTCIDNMDKNFADCSIPQEKSNAEINAELEISDASGEEDDYSGHRNYKELEFRRPPVFQQSSFIQIESNKFLHRSRRTQTIDEVMVCHCESPSDGRLGCGDECLNRMLNIECVQGTCPCGDLCSNQQFQKRSYVEMQWFRCGKKGYGLQLLQDVRKGRFIIEYVGEVLDMPTYEERQREYASKGHKHFYFMTLNGSEVIDASAKGNLGRFINHSCEPNCRTEKWMVNGEICIGLFALRDLKKGEEVTFDYNYVRVFGAAAKKCVCGSPLCRGYIGGDPLNTEVIVQVDSDDEYPEPVMLLEDGNPVNTKHDIVPETNLFNGVETLVVKNEKNGSEMDVSAKISSDLLQTTEPDSDSADESSVGIYKADRLLSINHPAENFPSSASPVDVSHERTDATSMPVVVSQEESAEKYPLDVNLNSSEKSETSLKKLHSNSLSQDASRKSKSDMVDEKSSKKVHSGRTISKKPSSVKRGKEGNSSLSANKCMGMASKAQLFSFKPKKAVEGRFEAVQEKLNELLDADGGISKRKDAPRGYLKLLFLTAASGDNVHGEAIQSNRDLSMILDALLKTRSRVVLTDIINKNGLRMLHNIMKQYRKDFKKIPILRKLLKVLEYLAVREILTVDHINVGPPCPGMESFRESMLSLTEHDDKQVHQIARNFRDRWLPRNIRKLGYVDRDDGFRGLSHSGPSGSSSSRYDRSVRPTEAIDCVKQSMVATMSSVSDAQDSAAVSTESSLTNGTRIRKRKSRWDQPAEPNLNLVPLLHEAKRATPASGCPGSVHDLCSLDKPGERTSNEDIPPGFSPSCETSQVSLNALTTAMDISQENMNGLVDAVSSYPQERFISRMPVSYGVPLSVLKQFGTPEAENGEHWTIAPGIPFQPFPPLPSYPRDHKRRLSEHTVDSWTGNFSEERQLDKCSTSSKCIDEMSPSTTVANQAEIEVPCASNQQVFKRMRGSSQDLGKRYFRQQKWNSTNKFPPWVRNRNCW